METNRLKRAWIWIWYNDVTRLCVLLGFPSIIVVFIVSCMFGTGEYLRTVAGVSYILFFGWAMMDNDYSNLRRIEMNEYRLKESCATNC